MVREGGSSEKVRGSSTAIGMDAWTSSSVESPVRVRGARYFERRGQEWSVDKWPLAVVGDSRRQLMHERGQSHFKVECFLTSLHLN